MIVRFAHWTLELRREPKFPRPGWVSAGPVTMHEGWPSSEGRVITLAFTDEELAEMQGATLTMDYEVQPAQ